MKNSRTTNAFLTMISSGIRQILAVVLTFASRTAFIHALGAEYLGLNGLFSNILSILALSELGIGSAISFYLYKPLANHDINRIQSLMHFYKLCYRAVGLTILGIGVAIMPVLPHIVNLNQAIPENLYLVFFLYVFNTASTYLFFAYKQALITADQQQYKIEKINIEFTFINCIIDIIILLIFRNYVAYLVTKGLLVIIKNTVIAHKVDRTYPYIKENKGIHLSKKEMKSFFKDAGSVSLFNIGSIMFNATDNIIISILLGTMIVGYYSNYYLIISQIVVFIGLIIKSFCAGIGNLIAEETKEKQFEIFRQLDFAVYCLVTICTACLFQLLNSFIKLWIGDVSTEYILDQSVITILCINFYIDGTTQIMNVFRMASGNFKIGRSLQMIGGICNIFLSIFLGNTLGLVGIFAATVISKGFITLIPFLVNISKSVFEKNKYMLFPKYCFNATIMLIILGVLWISGRHFHMRSIFYFVLECFLSFIVPIIVLIIVYRKTPEMKVLRERVSNMVYSFMRNRENKN